MSAPAKSFADLMSKVGSFLLCWSTLEQALSQSLRDALPEAGQGSVVGTFKERLERWGELQQTDTDPDLVQLIAKQAWDLRKIRNLIVHGLNAGNAMPSTGAGYIECVVGGYDSPTGQTVQYSVEDLDHLAQAADACRRAFARPRNFNFHLDPQLADRASDSTDLG